MNIVGRGFVNPGRNLRRGGEKKEKKISGGSLLGSEESAISRHEIAGGSGKAAHGGVLPGERDTICATKEVPGNVDPDGRAKTDPVGSGGGKGCPGIPGMGLEPGTILSDVERIEEGILIAIGALERAIDRLAITRQAALDMMEE